MYVLRFLSVFILIFLAALFLFTWVGNELRILDRSEFIKSYQPPNFLKLIVHFRIPYKTTIWAGVAIIHWICARCFLIWSAKVSRSLGFAIFVHQKTRCRLKTKRPSLTFQIQCTTDAQHDRPKVVTFQYFINGSWFIENQIQPTAASSCWRSIWTSMFGSLIDWSN